MTQCSQGFVSTISNIVGLNMISFGSTLGFSFVLNISFNNRGLRLLIALTISIARFLIILMFVIVLLDFSDKVS